MGTSLQVSATVPFSIFFLSYFFVLSLITDKTFTQQAATYIGTHVVGRGPFLRADSRWKISMANFIV